VRKLVTMRKALGDAALLGDALKGPSWEVWRVLLIAACGERLSKAERLVFEKFTGRSAEPGALIDTWLTVSGRRSGKTTAAAAMVVYLSCLCDWSKDLSLGERGVALYAAPSQAQAGRAFRYAREFVRHSPLMRKLVVSETATSIALSNGIDIEVEAANWRTVRGATCVAIVLDEVAHLRSEPESSNRDEDLITALRPSLVTTGGPMLLISSPGGDIGVVHAFHRRHYGKDGDRLMLVVQSDSKSLNPRLSQARIDREYGEDPVAAQSEWGGQFRAPTTQWLPRAVIERAVATGVAERPPVQRKPYAGFCDMAGGEGRDSATLAIGHIEGERLVVDLVDEVRPPFNSEMAVARFAEHLKRYGIRRISGDLYAKGWPTQSFARHFIEYSEDGVPNKSDIYLHCIALFTANRVDLVDCPRLVDQLIGLRRKVGSGSRETVDHLRNQHDDLSNSVCGLLWKLAPVERRLQLVISDQVLARARMRPPWGGMRGGLPWRM
jgi:hypothetical protein